MMAPLLPPVPTSQDDGPRRKKSVTRRTVLARRDAMSSEERRVASAVIAEHAIAVIPATGIVALYAAKGTEVATAALDAQLRARGQLVAYPRLVDGTRVLAFHLAQIDELVASPRLGIPEPASDAPGVRVDQLAAVVLPGLAFDRTGGRVGWGRGYYDTTLANTTIPRIGLAFACQVLDEIPREAHDVPLDRVITEER